MASPIFGDLSRGRSDSTRSSLDVSSSARTAVIRAKWKLASGTFLSHTVSKQSLLRRPKSFSRAWFRDIADGRLRTHGAGAYHVVLKAVALLSVCTVMAWSCEAHAEVYGWLLTSMDAALTGLCLADYAVRLAVAPEMRCYRRESPWQARVHYAFSLRGVMDAMGVFPAILALHGTCRELLPPKWVRLLRLLSLLRSHRQTHVFGTVLRILHANRRILMTTAWLCCFMLLWTSATLWLISSDSQEQPLPNIFSALYVAVLMLTGAGMPEGDLPLAMKLMVVMTAILSVAFFAIPAAMLTWGFEGEAERLARRELRQTRLRRLGNIEVSAETARGRATHFLSSSSSEGDSMAEYLQSLGGGEDPEELMDKALAFFESCDPRGEAPLHPRALQQAEALHRQIEQETLRKDLRETAYWLLMRLGREQRQAHNCVELRLRCFARAVQEHLAKPVLTEVPSS